MKKICIISTFIVLFVISFCFFIVSSYRLQKIKSENSEVKIKLNNIEKSINKIVEENGEYKNKISDMEKNNIEILEEYGVWKKTKEKLNQSLSH